MINDVLKLDIDKMTCKKELVNKIKTISDDELLCR